MDVHKPLKQRLGLSITGKGQGNVEVKFRYKRLSAFCLSCERIGHSERFCLYAFNSVDSVIVQNYSLKI